MGYYICPGCCKEFDIVPAFLNHKKRNVGCHDKKIMLRSRYNELQRQANPRGTADQPSVQEPLPVWPPVSDPSPASFNPSYTFAPPNQAPSLVPTAAQLAEFQLGTASSFGNGSCTYSSFDVFDHFPTLSFNPSNHFAGNLGAPSQDLLRNPWAEGADAACSSNAELTETVQDNLATQTCAEAPPAKPGPGALDGNVEDFLFAEKAYIRRVSKGRVIYQHPTAGQTYGKGQTKWEAERKKNDEIRNGNQYAMWGSKDEWESVKWMATNKVSQSSINDLLKTERYRQAKYSFSNAKSLFKKIEKEMGGFGGPEWHAEDIALAEAPKDKSTLFWRDLQECADFQMGQLRFAGKMSFAPELHLDADEATRLFGNPWTADDWHERQETLPRGTTYGGIFMASDSTILSTHSGDVAAHAVYMTLANLDQSVRASTSEDAWVLVAYIPKSKFQHAMSAMEDRPKAVRTKLLGVLNRRLFHRCMSIITRPLRRTDPHDVVDPEGNIRSVLYELTGYIADLEEQWLVSGLGGQTCPHCSSHTTNLGDVDCGPSRDPDDVLKTIKKIKKDYKAAWGRSPSLEEFVNLAGEHHLNGVDKPFWQSLRPRLDIFHVLSPDLLHGFHKYFYDHIFRFNRTGMGQDEYDARLLSQVQFSGDRTFLHGVSHISQMTGNEHRLLERTHLPIVAGAPGVINEKVIRATRGAVDCIYLAQLPTQSERTLQAYEAAYRDFMANRQAWIDNGTRRGKKEVIPHFNIPKMHVTRHHVHHVRRKGSANNYTTETMEHLHKGVKDAYRASNRREWKEQMVRWLTRRERIRDFEAWMAWCEMEKKRKELEHESVSQIGHGDNPTCGELNTEDGSDDSSVVPELVDEDVGTDGEGEIEGGGEEDYEDPEAYGERLADEEEGQESATNDRVRCWLARQASAEVGGGSRKRKRRSDLDDPTPRSRPRPRLQKTHLISDLQKINFKPSKIRKPIQEICQSYDLKLPDFLRQVKQSSHLTNLPITVDEYTLIDVWHSLRTHLHSAAHKSGAKMQRIRSKPANGSRAAKHDPVFFVNAEGKNARTAEIGDCSVAQVRLIFRLTPCTLIPNPPLMTYVSMFTKIPRLASRITGLRTISKVGGPPVIHGPAPRDVHRDNVLDRFSDFYLNRFRNIDDYMFMYSNAL
ncbi:hypothetical protein FRC09_005560 [Ceratobasidium sp. 395]|nr:hypothetical protein FRC09_005560 [Ceratobasidium sp. 395]